MSISFPAGELPLDYSPARDGASVCRAEKAALGSYWSMLSKGKDGAAALEGVVSVVVRSTSAKSSIDAAKKCLRRALSENDPRAALDSGFLYLIQGEYAQAIGEFNDVLRADPLSTLAVNGSVAALMLQMKALSDDQRVDWSKQIAGRLGERMRGSGGKIGEDEFLRAAYLYYVGELLPPAMVYIESGLKLYPDSEQLMLGRALIWARGGEYDESLKDIEVITQRQGADARILDAATRLKGLCLAAKAPQDESAALLQGLACSDSSR